MWALAGVAAGLRWGWPAVILFLKPTLAPFALVGVRKPSFWVAGAAMLVVALVMMPLWLDYFTAIRNLRIPWDYSLVSIPPMFIPIVAWAAATSATEGLVTADDCGASAVRQRRTANVIERERIDVERTEIDAASAR